MRFDRVTRHIALIIQVHRAVRTQRRNLAEIQGHLITPLGVDNHKPSSSQVAGRRVGDGQRKTNRNRCINGIASLLHNADANF